MKKALEWILIYLRGVLMGGADIVPGVSGGTMALLTGIYTRLIEAIKSVDARAFKLFFTGKWKEFWTHIDGSFLIVLIAGIGTSLFTLARGVEYLLEHQPLLLWSFFFGLVLASTFVVLRKIKKWSWLEILLFAAGGTGAWILVGMSPVSTPEGLPFVFLAGMIAITAMILPGISGSLILVLLGKYSSVLAAVTGLDIPFLAVFVLGCLVGITAFSRLLGFLLKRWWPQTIAVLAGFMVGSLNRLWPWKQTLETFIDRHGEVQPLIQKNVGFWNYLDVTGSDPQVLGCVLCFLGGLAVVLVIETLAIRSERGGPETISDRETQA